MANERRPAGAASGLIAASKTSVAHVMRTVCGLTEPAASVIGTFSQVQGVSAGRDRRINGPSTAESDQTAPLAGA